MKQSIENINNILITIKDTFATFIIKEKEIRNLSDIVHGEFTLKDIISDTEFLIKIINYLVKSNNLFFNISTQQDRVNIFNNLNNLNSHFLNTNFNSIIAHLDVLKTCIRNYNPVVLSKKEFLSDIGNDILEIQSNSKISSSLLEKINSDIELKEKIIKKLEKLEEDYNNLDLKLNIISKKKDEIIEMTTEAESNKRIIDNFSSEIEKRKEDLTKITNTTNNYTEKLEEFEIERLEKLKEAKGLIEKSKKALNYTTTEGISASIQTQYDKAKDGVTTGWIISAIFFIILTLSIGLIILFPEIIKIFKADFKIENSNIYSLIGRISLLPITISGAIFSASQYVKQKNLIEDYAYKLVLVKSIIGFSEELLKVKDNTNEGYQKYITKTLDELLQDPLRDKNNKKNEKVISSKSLKEGLDFIKQAKDVTE